MLTGFIRGLFDSEEPESEAFSLARKQRRLTKRKKDLVEDVALKKAAAKSLKDKSDARATDPEIANSFLI